MRTKIISKYALLATFSLVITLVSGVIITKNTHTQIRYFEYVLKENNVTEQVTTRSGIYMVTNGVISSSLHGKISARERSKVLRIAYAKTAAKRSPVFALAGVDLDAYITGLQELSSIQTQLAQLQETSIEKILVANTLYPLSFLRAVIAAEDSRRVFIATGYVSDARVYNRLLKRIPRAYQRDSFLFERSYTYLVPSTAPKYITERHTITRENSLDTYQNLRKKMDMNTKALRTRTRCFAGDISACTTSSISLPYVQNVQTNTGVQDVPVFPNKNIMSSFYNSLQKFRPDTTLFKLLEGPHVLLTESTCVNTDIQPLFALRSENKSSGIFEFGDVRFLETVEYKNVPFFSFFKDESIDYVPISPLHHYTCATLDTEIGRIHAVWEIALFAKEFPLGSYSRELQFVERELSKDIVSENTAREYINRGLDLMAIGALPTSQTKTIINLALQLQNSSSHIESLLRGIAATEKRNVELAKNGAPVNIQSEHLFFSRNGFSGLSMQGNTSFGETIKLFEPSVIPKRQTPYVYLSEIADKEISITELTADTYTYTLLHEK